MKEQTRINVLDQIIDEIISEMPLKERTVIANMDEKDVEVLQSVFDLYFRSKIDIESGDEEYASIMDEIWKRLRETHLLRVVK